MDSIAVTVQTIPGTVSRYSLYKRTADAGIAMNASHGGFWDVSFGGWKL
jgi:hypothetical protein